MRVCAKTKAIFTEIATFPCKLACLTNTPNLNRLVEDLIQTHTHTKLTEKHVLFNFENLIETTNKKICKEHAKNLPLYMKPIHLGLAMA